MLETNDQLFKMSEGLLLILNNDENFSQMDKTCLFQIQAVLAFPSQPAMACSALNPGSNPIFKKKLNVLVCFVLTSEPMACDACNAGSNPMYYIGTGTSPGHDTSLGPTS